MNRAERDIRERYDLRKLGKRLIYILLAVAAFFFVKARFLTPPRVRVAPVRRQNLAAEVESSGTVTVDVLARVGAKIPGRIERVFVDQGDFVHRGQIIAELEDTDIQRQLQDAQARLAAAEANEAAARAEVQAKQATEWETKRDWQREKHLLATDAVSQEEADEYEEQYLTAASAVRAAQAEVKAAQGEVIAAEAEVGYRKFELSETKIFTYVSGVVMDLPKRPGDAVVPGEPVATIADPKLTMVDAYVDQRFSGEISKGEPATVILWGRRNDPFHGRVYRVSPEADPATEEVTVEISFPLPPKLLEVGQWADAYIQVGEAMDALVVPNTAILPMGNRQMVLVDGPNHKVRPARVEVVASSPRSPLVAVEGNLEPGNLVLVKPMGIRPGQKVRIAESRAPSADAAGSNSQAMAAPIR